MPAIPAKQMLREILASTLSAADRQTYEDLWDSAHRYGLSRKQTGWVERVYYKLKTKPPEPVKRSQKTGKVNMASILTPKQVSSLVKFKALCPEADAAMLERVEKFFASGGEVLQVLPKE